MNMWQPYYILPRTHSITSNRIAWRWDNNLYKLTARQTKRTK